MEPATGEAGEETFEVNIVCESNEHTIDARKAAKALNALAAPLEELGPPPVLMQGYVSKDEYPTMLEMKADAISGEDEE